MAYVSRVRWAGPMPAGSVSLLGVADSLDGEDVLPGFSLPVATVME